MWLHKFIPQPCFDNAGAEGGGGGGSGNTRGTMKDMPGRATGSKSIGAASGYGGNESSGIMMSGGGYKETAQGIPGYGTPQQARATNYGGTTSSPSSGRSSGGGSSSVTRTALPPPAYTPPAVVKTPTIAAPSLAQLTALNKVAPPKGFAAASLAMVDDPALAGVMAMKAADEDTASRVGGLVGNLASPAASKPSSNTTSGRPGAVGTPGVGGGFSSQGSLADVASTSGRPGGVGTPGVGGGFDGTNRGGRPGGVGTPGVGGGFDGPSFSGGPQSNPASNAGNAVLGQSRSNVISGQQDPSTNAIGYSAAPGLLSRVGAANQAQNNSVLGQAVNAMGNLTGMAPVGLLANQAQIARDQFRTENPMSTNPVAEVTVNTGLLEDRPEEPDQWAEVDISNVPSTMQDERDKQAQTLADAVARAASNAMAAEPGTMAQDRAAELAKALSGNPDQQQTVTKSGPAMSMPGRTAPATRSPLGYQGAARQVGARAAAQSQANSEAVANAVKGLLNNQIDYGPTGLLDLSDTSNPNVQKVLDKAIDFDAEPSATDIRNQMLRENSMAVQNAVKGLLNKQSQTTPASIPNAQPMPGSISENMNDISVVKRLRDNVRRASIGGSPTDTQGETAPSGKGLLDYSRNPPTIEWTGRAANDPEEQKISGELKGVLNEALKAGIPIKIRSGYRNPSKNARVGGARGSAHMQGKAVDISLKGLSDAQRTALTVALINAGAKRVGAYSGNTGLHVDMRDMGGGASHGDFHAMFDKTARNLNKAPSWFRDALQQASSGGDAIDAALNDQEAQAFLEQQGYSQTDDGKWTNGAQSFDNPIDAVKSLPLMDQLRAYIMWTRGGTPPPSRDGTNRGGGEWRPPGLLSASMGGPVTQPGNDNTGGGGPFVNGAGNWVPPGLLSRPYSNPWATRNPWLNV